MKKEYKFRDVIKVTGVTHSQISYWGDKGWIALPESVPERNMPPSKHDAETKTKKPKPKKGYPFTTLVRIALMKTMVDAGLEAESAAEVASIATWLMKEDMKVDLEDPGSKALLVNDPDTYVLNIVNANRIVYLARVAPDRRVETSRLVSPVQLKVGGQYISRAGEEIDFQSGVLDQDQKFLLDITGIHFKIEINVKIMMRIIYSII